MVIPMFAELEAQNVGCTIVFLDVDDFKDINDTYGHQYGDELLKTVARVLDEQKPEEVWYIDSVEMNLSCLSLGTDMTLLRSI